MMPQTAAMTAMARNAMTAMEKTLNVKFSGPPPTVEVPLPLGVWAHELGSLPMPAANPFPSVLDANLTLKNRRGVSVCDLSVFPFSPAANPSLTLAALALRLSDFLLRPKDVELVDTAPGDNQGWVRDNSEDIFVQDSDISREIVGETIEVV
jgi:choline dehydrogenase-like flavoprotein